MPVYDLAIVREMLSEAFSTGEINTLAFDLFPKLYRDFAGSMSKSDRIEQIVIEAQQHGRIPDLLAYVEKKNPYQHNRFAPQLIQEEPQPNPTTRLAGWQQRKADLERHIQADLQLLAEYEDALRLEDDPRRRRHQREIERQQKSLANYRQELETLQREIVHDSATTDTTQPLLDAIADLKQTITRQHSQSQQERREMEARLTAGQQAILNHIDEKHQETVRSVLDQLNANQLELVEMMLNAAEKGNIKEHEAKELLDLTSLILDILRDRPDGDYWQRLLDAVEEPASLEQKLKLILPIIPGILGYETELTVNSMGWLKQSWRYVTNRIRRRS